MKSAFHFGKPVVYYEKQIKEGENMEESKVPQAAQNRMVGFIAYCGAELIKCSPGEGCETRVVIQPHHRNFYGNVHGGMISTLMDATAGLTASFAGPEQRPAVTRSADIHYFLPVSGAEILAKGHVIRAGKTMCLVYVDVLNADETICATGAFEYFYVDHH